MIIPFKQYERILRQVYDKTSIIHQVSSQTRKLWYNGYLEHPQLYIKGLQESSDSATNASIAEAKAIEQEIQNMKSLRIKQAINL